MLEEEVHNKILAYQRIERIILSDTFKRVWKQANESERKNLTVLAIEGRSTAFENTLKIIHPKLTYKYIQLLCSQNHIFKYSRMTKAEMVKELIKKNIIKEEMV